MVTDIHPPTMAAMVMGTPPPIMVDTARLAITLGHVITRLEGTSGPPRIRAESMRGVIMDGDGDTAQPHLIEQRPGRLACPDRKVTGTRLFTARSIASTLLQGQFPESEPQAS